MLILEDFHEKELQKQKIAKPFAGYPSTSSNEPHFLPFHLNPILIHARSRYSRRRPHEANSKVELRRRCFNPKLEQEWSYRDEPRLPFAPAKRCQVTRAALKPEQTGARRRPHRHGVGCFAGGCLGDASEAPRGARRSPTSSTPELKLKVGRVAFVVLTDAEVSQLGPLWAVATPFGYFFLSFLGWLWCSCTGNFRYVKFINYIP